MLRRIDGPLFQLAKRQHGVISYEQLREQGVTIGQLRRRLESGEWIRALPSVVRVYWADQTWMERVWAASLWFGPQAFISFGTAACLWGLDVRRTDSVHVSSPKSLWRARSWIEPHYGCAEGDEVQMNGGIPTSSPARTLVDLAGMLTDCELEIAVTKALHNKLLSFAEFRRAVGRMPVRGKAGTGRVGVLFAKLKACGWAKRN
jgi:hypothetical protein